MPLIFSKDDPGKRLWDWVMIILNTYVLISVPFFPSFTMGNRSSLFLSLDIVCDVIFIVDMWLSTRTTIEQYGVLVVEAHELKHLYLNSAGFYQDLISALPLEIVALIYSVIKFGSPNLKVGVFPLYNI